MNGGVLITLTRCPNSQITHPVTPVAGAYGKEKGTEGPSFRFRVLKDFYLDQRFAEGK